MKTKQIKYSAYRLDSATSRGHYKGSESPTFIFGDAGSSLPKIFIDESANFNAPTQIEMNRPNFSTEKSTAADFQSYYSGYMNDKTFIYGITNEMKQNGIDDSLDMLYDSMAQFLIKKDIPNIKRILINSINEIQDLSLLTGILTLTKRIDILDNSRNVLKNYTHRIASERYGSEEEADDLLRGL